MDTIQDRYGPGKSVHAVVFTDGIRMPYQRIGTGRAVMIIGKAKNSATAINPLVGTLASHFSVLIPSPPESTTGRPLIRTARGLLDGLGLTRVCLVADEAIAAEALWLTVAETDRVAALAILVSGPPDPVYPDGLPVEHLAYGGQPVLLARLAGGTAPTSAWENSVAAILRFLEEASEPKKLAAVTNI